MIHKSSINFGMQRVNTFTLCGTYRFPLCVLCDHVIIEAKLRLL